MPKRVNTERSGSDPVNWFLGMFVTMVVVMVVLALYVAPTVEKNLPPQASDPTAEVRLPDGKLLEFFEFDYPGSGTLRCIWADSPSTSKAGFWCWR